MSATCRERDAGGRGFTMISALFLLVVLTALGAALAKVSMRQQLGSASDLASAYAQQAARAGLEWGAWKVLKETSTTPAACFASTNISLSGALAGMVVTVSCTRTPGSGTVSDGDTSLAFFKLVANACNAPVSGACPATGAIQATYVESR
jgi:MSHA biogenesis protein MshP